MSSEDEDIQEALENILKSVARSENIENFEVHSNKSKGQGEGFLSELFTGYVLNKENGETLEVAMKRASINGFSGDSGNENIYKNEVNFYSKLFPQLDKFQRIKEVIHPFDHIPRYLAGSVDSDNLFVAMENLKPEGYVVFDKKKYMDKEHLELIFKTYGKFHALSFTFKHENPDTYEKLISILENVNEKFVDSEDLVALIEKAYLSALETFNPLTEADILAKLKMVNIREAIKKVRAYTGDYGCLIHGDAWSNNMLFKYKASGKLKDIKLIDFQMPFSGTPVRDLSYFFYSGASKLDMDKLDDYLDLYYQSFSDFAREMGGDPEQLFPLNVLKEEWKKYGTLGIFLGCQLWIAKLMDQEEIRDVLNQKGLRAEEYWELFAKNMFKIRDGDAFKERARNIYLHAVEYGIL